MSEAPAPGQVLVVDDRIAAVGPDVDAPAGARVVDLPGHTLTPGFMDCHTHVTINPDIAVTAVTMSSAQKALHAIPVPRALLDNGFTTIRDLCGADVEPTTVHLRDAVDAGLIDGPRMLVTPHLISARGGHGDFSGGLADQFQSCCRPLELGAADGPEEIRVRVRQQVRAGANWIKFASSGGFSTPSDDPGLPSYSQEEMDAIVATASDLGCPCHPALPEQRRRQTRRARRRPQHRTREPRQRRWR